MHSDDSPHHPHPSDSSLAAALGNDMPVVQQLDYEPLRKKDGTLSKIRSHRGNIPVLPQTKLCPHCPAKFTRTTHLNRHLRNHTNERLHRCETCDSQFTRSDLLTRHKKSCNNPTSRTRRRSCLACTDSKIKCDRQVPCSKCVSKGVECIYGPTTRRSSLSTALVPPPANPAASRPSNSSFRHSFRNQPALSGPAASPLAPASSQQTPSSLSHPASTPYCDRTTTCSKPNSPSDTSFPSSSSASAQVSESAYSAQASGLVYVQDSEGYQQQHAQRNVQDYPSTPVYPVGSFVSDQVEVYSPSESESTATDDHLVPVSSHLSPAYGSDVFTPFFTTIFPQSSPASTITEVTVNLDELNVRGESPEDFPFARLLTSGSSSIQNHIYNPETNIQQETYHTFEVDQAQSCLRAINTDPTSAELQHYMHIFFTTFLAQLPIVHSPTYRAEKKSPILLSAMQACGALFVGSKRATEFISKTLASARETLVNDFARNSTDLLDQVQLILAVVLLQTIGLFHQQSDQRASSTIYHGMLVMMIRQAGLIPFNANWTPSNITETNLESAWFDWARNEMAKRAILWSYMHDCCHCIYFSLSPSYHPQEVILNLPCEEALWQATSARDWYMILQRPSPYGTTQTSRLTGMSIPKMMNYLSESRTIPTTIPLAPFAHFALIHILLKRLFQFCSGGKSARPVASNSQDELDPEMCNLQFALHNWLQNWRNSPDSRVEVASGEPPFIQNLLPFYWLGQVAMLAYQENLPPFRYNPNNPASSNIGVEARFRLIKRWLRHIRAFLQSHDEAPTLFWDELMKLRLQTWQQEIEIEGVDEQEGLLEFF